MEPLEIALLAILLLYPLLDIFFANRYQSHSKSVDYIKISLELWAMTALLLYAFAQRDLSVSAAQLLPSSTFKTYLALTLLLLFIGYQCYSIKAINANSDYRQQIAEQFQKADAAMLHLLPNSRHEFLLFTVVLSVSAGVCEELIFRWYLYEFLQTHNHWLAAIFGSSLLFGLWHIYLGWQHVLRATIIGGVLCGIYLYFESILVVMLLHILMDVYSGSIAYYARRLLL